MTLYGGRIPNEGDDGWQAADDNYIMVPGFGAQRVVAAANDNAWTKEEATANGWPLKDVPPPGWPKSGQYIGLRRTTAQMRATHEEHEDNVAKWRAGDTLTYRKQQGVEALAELPGFVYLGSPYAKYPHGLEEAARVVSECAGVLMQRGLRIYCPIAHGHAASRNVSLPRSWDFWKAQDQPLIDAAAAIIVLEMQGWRDSVGLTYEISEFMRAGKPILHLCPDDLRVSERRAAA